MMVECPSPSATSDEVRGDGEATGSPQNNLERPAVASSVSTTYKLPLMELGYRGSRGGVCVILGVARVW